MFLGHCPLSSGYSIIEAGPIFRQKLTRACFAKFEVLTVMSRKMVV
jgi:hypothetical protein